MRASLLLVLIASPLYAADNNQNEPLMRFFLQEAWEEKGEGLIGLCRNLHLFDNSVYPPKKQYTLETLCRNLHLIDNPLSRKLNIMLETLCHKLNNMIDDIPPVNLKNMPIKAALEYIAQSSLYQQSGAEYSFLPLKKEYPPIKDMLKHIAESYVYKQTGAEYLSQCFSSLESDET